jgi:mannan endo-1,6-alpha-mannosidase
MTLIQYWYFTGDTTYNEVTNQGLLFQIGPDKNYLPPNQTKQLGNDDQAFWAFAVLTAAGMLAITYSLSDVQSRANFCRT